MTTVGTQFQSYGSSYLACDSVWRGIVIEEEDNFGSNGYDLFADAEIAVDLREGSNLWLINAEFQNCETGIKTEDASFNAILNSDFNHCDVGVESIRSDLDVSDCTFESYATHGILINHSQIEMCQIRDSQFNGTPQSKYAIDGKSTWGILVDDCDINAPMGVRVEDNRFLEAGGIINSNITVERDAVIGIGGGLRVLGNTIETLNQEFHASVDYQDCRAEVEQNIINTNGTGGSVSTNAATVVVIRDNDLLHAATGTKPTQTFAFLDQ